MEEITVKDLNAKILPLLSRNALSNEKFGDIQQHFSVKYQAFMEQRMKKQSTHQFDVDLTSVSYTHLTLPTILLVQISVVSVSLKKKRTFSPLNNYQMRKGSY
eukprot:TRINITY_DN25335_c0_g1_i1.p3 TRINITY_DN25335_c0_g1~~TRINITY_DN25335_c0_g1_i1.p3  ORF type:complete len:103 (-),score=15.44 TRINITY_DN25335_c0_g1_i1:85-393(-)